MAMIDQPTANAAGVVRVELQDDAPWLIALGALATVGAAWLRVAGLPRADLHGPLHKMGIMDPFCGGTRATYLLVRGDLLSAWSWNPLVPLLAVGVMAVIVRFIVGRVSGRWVSLRVPRRAWVGAAVVGFAVLEVNQQIQADRLISAVPT